MQSYALEGVGWLAAGFLLGGFSTFLFWRRIEVRLRRLVGQIGALASEHDAGGEILPAAAPGLFGWRQALDRAEYQLIALTDALRAERDAALQANQTKTRFLAVASHDLRQPLQALGLFVAALAQRAPVELQNVVGKIETSLEAFEHLLDGLLDISRLDAGAIEAHSTRFPLQALFDRMAMEFEPLAERKGLRLGFVANGVTLQSDPDLLDRILRNLLSNAVRYTSRGGIVVGVRCRAATLRIEIWDTGIGIAPADQQDVFREFHQLETKRSELRDGLGLGLAIVDRLVDLIGGSIELRSEPGKGSVFAVVLPREGNEGKRHGQ